MCVNYDGTRLYFISCCQFFISLFTPSCFSFNSFCFCFSFMCCCDRMKTIKYEFSAIDLDWFVKSCYPLNSFVHWVIGSNCLTSHKCRSFLWFKILICFYGTLIANPDFEVDLVSPNWLRNVWISIMIIIYYVKCWNSLLC